MKLTAEQIEDNWEKFIGSIELYISQPRQEALLNFYNKYKDRLILMPASHKVAYHNCFPGGYVEHVNRVIEASISVDEVWKSFGVDANYTLEELVFSALNHDLGKMGTKDEPMYLPNPSQWHIDNRGELYEVNNKLAFMSVPDRSLFLLTENDIKYSENEYLAIKLHDGMYDEANKPYLMSYLPETKPRTSLIYILHQADMLASRIEFEREWSAKLKVSKPVPVAKTPKKTVLSANSATLSKTMEQFFNK